MEVTSLFPRAEPMFSALDAATEQERVRLALHALRDLLDAAPAVVTFDPQSIAALVGLCADALPVLPECEEG